MPKKWVRSAINVYTDIGTQSINATPMGTISYQCLHRHKHVINQKYKRYDETVNVKHVGKYDGQFHLQV